MARFLKKLLCDILGWHTVSSIQSFDGLSFCSRCSRCGRRVLMDSNCDWFSVEDDWNAAKKKD